MHSNKLNYTNNPVKTQVVLYFLLAFVGILTGVLLSLAPLRDEYSLLAILPVAYLFFLLFAIRPKDLALSNPFVAVLVLVGFVRYVIYPLGMFLIDGDATERSWTSPSIQAFHEATILMSYEVIVVALFIFVFRYSRWIDSIKMTEVVSERMNSRRVFIVFGFVFIFSLIGLFLRPQSLLYISFIFPNIATKGASVEPELFTKLIVYVFIISKQLLAISFVKYLSDRYNETNARKYKFYAVLISLFSTLIYFGVSRIDFIISVVAMFVVYTSLFGQLKNSSKIFVLVFLIAVFTLITNVRGYHSTSDNNLGQVVDYAQGYTGGVYNVAIGIEVEDWYPEASSLVNLAFDFTRPVIGLNIFVKHLDVKYSNIYYNDRMWTHLDRRSQIMPMVAQSNLYFGPALAPLLTVLFVFVGLVLQNLAANEHRTEIQYFYIYCAMRTGFVFGQNSMNILNEISFSLILPLILILALRTLSRVKMR